MDEEPATYAFELRLTVEELPDGSFIATGADLPVFIAAKDRERLQVKISEVQHSIELYLARVSL